MFLYFNGCSYTHGKGCEDRKKQRFSTLVSDRLGADHFNDSRSGSSNDKIVERTMTWLKDNTCDYGIILMTHCARMQMNKKMLPMSQSFSKEEEEINQLFYDKFYSDELGATNFYRNRYILEQAFEKRGIPLLLFQYCPLPCQKTNIWKEYCDGDLPLVSKTFWNNFELSSSIDTILGRRKNKKYYWSEKDNRTIGHFNYKGHEKVADWIIGKLTPTI
tara:strand:- start:690 stop:1343 length:654 start_codon:yes stop_codon:yes gene_type:complete